MNENNALSQLRLIEEISKLRQKHYIALEEAIVRLDLAGRIPACTYSAMALFLCVLARRTEELITREIYTAESCMEKMHDLPDDEQWEYRIAYTLGVVEGLNAIGQIQSQILEKAQSALHKASILALAAGGKSALPAHTIGKADHLHAIEEEANARQNKRLKEICRLGSNLAQVFHKDALDRDSAETLTIASVCTTATDLTTSALLLALSTFAMEVFDKESTMIAEVDAIKQQQGSAQHTARATAAGIVGGLITAMVQKNEPWLAINLN